MDKSAFIKRASELEAAYKPNFDTRQHMALVDLIAVVGPSGVGKTTIMEKSGLHFVLSDITRTLRAEERDGFDYIFRNDYERLLKEIESGEFVQYVIERGTEFYGTKTGSYPQSGVCTMAIIASVIAKFQQLGFRNVTPVYILPPDFDEWMRRIAAHEYPDLPARLLEAKQSLEVALKSEDYIYLVNDYVDGAVESFRRIAGVGSGAAPDQTFGREIAEDLLTQLTAKLKPGR